MTDGVCRRKIYLVDIENLIGGPSFWALAKMWALIQENIPVGPDDVVLVGTGYQHYADVIDAAWPQARCIIYQGEDGADLALLYTFDTYNLALFSEVVIVSGDHIFAKTVTRLLKRGISVTILSSKRHTSHKLRETGARMIAIEDCPAPGMIDPIALALPDSIVIRNPPNIRPKRKPRKKQ